MKNFYRKVAFGLGPNEQAPSDPLEWAKNQLNDIPEFSWKGKILPEKELRNYYRDYVYGDRKVLRKKFKNDKEGYKREKNKLRHATGQKFWWNLELCIRYSEALKSETPVLAKLWYFWGNHFAISEKDFLAQYTTGAYQREIIRANMNQNFEKMAQEATIGWSMIHHLDNEQNIGPKSQEAKWAREKGKTKGVNENHARELLELHTVSPDCGYTQEDVIQMAYIMSGWRPKWGKKRLETGDVHFNPDAHEPGTKIVLGKKYKRGRKSLSVAITDLVNHPSCRKFIAMKLCRYLITDNPTEEMMEPIIKAWEKSDGFLPEVHKAAIEVAFNYSDKYNKFQNPENWLLQMSKMADVDLIPSPSFMDLYQLGNKPIKDQRALERLMDELGQHPYLAKQPNGWSDISEDWMSPELLIRRLVYAREAYYKKSGKSQTTEFYEEMIEKNYDNPSEILQIINQHKELVHKHVILFNLPETLKS
ncbi:DUF1800 domain-containing protein [Candidatus Pelagibacter sp.]|nr:DUF1800 domain-containing protein [Candidatus Pelagibacter sp.]